MKARVTTGLLVLSLLASTATATPLASLPRDAGMQALVDRVLNMTDLHNDVVVVIDRGARGCAYAATNHGQQYIGVDPNCVGPLMRQGVYEWRSVGILCHEIGHLLSGHTTNEKVDNPIEESAADEFSGFMMFRLGASLDQAQTFARGMPKEDSATHPGRAKRIATVEIGWRKAANATTEASGGWWGRLMGKPLPWLAPAKITGSR